MSTNFVRSLRNLVFPSDVALSTDFPWDRGVLRTFGVMLVALLAVVLSPLVVLIPVLFAGGVLTELVPEVRAFVLQHQVVLAAVMETAVYATGFGIAILFLRSRLRGVSPSSIPALVWSKFSIRDVGRGLLGYVVAISTVALVYQFLPLSEPQSPAADFGRTLGGFALLIFAFNTMVLAPIMEEIVFRGYFFNMLRRSLGRQLPITFADLLSVVVSGAIFAAVHGTVTGFPVLFVIGMVLAEVYRRTGSLQAAMWMHFFNNTVATLALILSLNI